MDARESLGIRLWSLALQLLWQQGKQPPGKGERNSASRRGPASLPTTAESVSVAGACLPPFSQAFPVPRSRRPALHLPLSPSPPDSPTPIPSHSYKLSWTGSECALLSNQPACLLPTIYLSPEGQRLIPQPPRLPLPFALPPTTSCEGLRRLEVKREPQPTFLSARGGGTSAAFTALSSNSLPSVGSGCASRTRHLVATSGRFSTKGQRLARARNRRGPSGAGPGIRRRAGRGRVKGGDVRWSGWGGGHCREAIGAPSVRVRAEAMGGDSKWPQDRRHILA